MTDVNGFQKILIVVVSAAICAGASEIPARFSDNATAIVSDEEILLGDASMDGFVNAIDASMVMSEYALLSTSNKTIFSEKQTKAADVNKDGKCDSIDATIILAYYSRVTTRGFITIEEYVNNEYYAEEN